MNEGLVFLISQSKHLQPGTPYVHRKGMRILRLLEVLKLHGLGLENKHYHHIKNSFTGEVFHHNKFSIVRRMETKFTMK